MLNKRSPLEYSSSSLEDLLHKAEEYGIRQKVIKLGFALSKKEHINVLEGCERAFKQLVTDAEHSKELHIN